ncbi:unnamed protein product [Meganyctiphanes norvegica]|uniref:C2H2-type domain-containing protein n=1 Tax=Meganyctiphanes norvegica TaxID=48144 RepID=A0AAV2RYN9_MEGNR
MEENCVHSYGSSSTMMNTGKIPQNIISSLQSFPIGSMALKRSNTNSHHKNKNKIKLKGIFCNVETCGERFATVELLELHRKIHEGVKPFICDVCRKVCQTESKLFAHKSSHANDGIRPICIICNRSFSSQSALNKHKKILHKPKPYTCPDCKAGFEKHQYMIIHAKREHGIENLKKCEENKTDPLIVVDKIDVTEDLSSSSSISANINVETITGKILEKTSDTPSNIENSRRISETVKFLCQMCTSTFPSQAYLEQHMSVHISEKKETHNPMENLSHPVNHMSVRPLNPHSVSRNNLKASAQDGFVNYAISDSYSQHVASNRIHNDPASFTFVSHHISHSVGISSLSDRNQTPYWT